MASWVRIMVVLAALCAATGLAEAKGHKSGASGSAIDGTWEASGTVTVARHIQNVQVGDHTSRHWTIKTTCKTKHCSTELKYTTSGGKEIRIKLHGAKSRWSGSLRHETFDCTGAGTATGSISISVRVTDFTKHHKRRVAKSMTGRGVQTGTGCAVVKEVVDFKITRRSF